MEYRCNRITPSALLVRNVSLLAEASGLGPVLDLAGGEGRNGLYLAGKGMKVVVLDGSESALESARQRARRRRVEIETRRVDLEREGANPIARNEFGGIIVFKYLYRPIMKGIREGIKSGGILIYETFTADHARFGKPSNPDFLLQPGELREWFADWEILFLFEGIKRNPGRAIAQLVCRKPVE